ncbi:MAG: amino acid permease, partial [Isosphaeraceae bacterium]|nr:amino acid permease [Isosphaeraceae bacterium]
GAMLPRAGGPYVYLRAAYGPLPAFLFGWTEFLVIRAGSMATLAAAFALYFSQLVPAPGAIGPELWEATAAIGAMGFLAVVNALGTKLGGRVQVVGTALKVGALVTMIVLPFVLGQASVTRLSPVMPEAYNLDILKGMATAIVGVLWAYDGWINSASLAEEIRDPGRNIPRALILGMAVLIALYLTMTLVYHMVLSMPEVQAAATERGSPKVVAAEFCRRLLGQRGVVAISLVVMCSTFISINGNCLTGPRAYFAMARDGLFPHSLARVHPRFRTPANAILAQASWAILLTAAGTAMVLLRPAGSSAAKPKPLYDLLYEYVIFGGTVLYMLTITSVFVLRVRRPDLPRPYRTFGYPVTPMLYVIAALMLLTSMLVQSFWQSLVGLVIIGAGVPAYYFFRAELTRPVASAADLE